MTRGMTRRGYTGFAYTLCWECGACGAAGEIQGDDDSGAVMETIDHTCEVDDA